MAGLLVRLLAAPRDYARHVLASRRRHGEAEPARVVQGVVLDGEGDGERVLLAVRVDLRGWELPGGHLAPGEDEVVGLRREIEEETGLRVTVDGLVGEYRRSGFMPHRARVYRCRPAGGTLRPSGEAPVLRWWRADALPETLFPWFRQPLEDALAGTGAAPVVRDEHQGFAAIWSGLRIDLWMRASNDRAGGAADGR